MPTNMSEAILFASQDEEEAEAVRLASQVRPRKRLTPRRACAAAAINARMTLSSAIRKRSQELQNS